jgi:hypothetical protein
LTIAPPLENVSYRQGARAMRSSFLRSILAFALLSVAVLVAPHVEAQAASSSRPGSGPAPLTRQQRGGRYGAAIRAYGGLLRRTDGNPDSVDRTVARTRAATEYQVLHPGTSQEIAERVVDARAHELSTRTDGARDNAPAPRQAAGEHYGVTLRAAARTPGNDLVVETAVRAYMRLQRLQGHTVHILAATQVVRARIAELNAQRAQAESEPGSQH